MIKIMRRCKCFDTKLLWLLVMAFMPCLTHARDFTYNSVNYTVLDEVAKTCATKAGNGVLTDSHPVETPGTKYTGATLDLPANPVDQSGTAYKLVEISSHSFYGCGIKTVKIPNTVTVIRTSAFERCQSMAGSLVIPNSVVEIENKAFSECKEVTSITLSNSLVSIGQSAFQKITYLKGELLIPNSVVSIGKWAFRSCTNLTSVSFGNSVESIGETAFQACTKLKGSLVLPASLKSIGTNAFSQTAFTEIECKALTPPTIPDQYYAFPTTTHSTAELLVPSESLNLYKSAWEWKEFTSISAIPILPESVSLNKTTASLKEGESVILSATVLPDDATDKTVTWTTSDESVATVRSSGFVMAVKSGEATITATTVNGLTATCKVTVIDPDPFTYTYNDANMTAIVSGLADWVTELQNPEIPSSKVYNGKTYAVKAIGGQAFFRSTKLKGQLTLPESLTSIGVTSFFGCTSLTGSLTIPASVTEIGASAFGSCSGLNGTLSLSGSLKTIGNNAFENCTSLTGNIVIPNSVEAIGNYAFAGCTGFTGTLTIGSSVRIIGNYAFNSCKGLSGSLSIGNSVTSIGTDAFRGCSGFKGTLTLGSSISSIGMNAFNGCSGFTGSLTIPNSVKTIGESAFYRCSGFTGKLRLSNTLTAISNQTFSGCSGFTGALTIPASMQTIDWDAFYGCKGFTEITSEAAVPPVLGGGTSTVFASSLYTSAKLIVPADSYNSYKTAFEWKNFTNIEVMAGADPFKYTYNDADLTATVTGLAAWVTELRDPVIPETTIHNGKTYTVTKIGADAFKYASSLKGSLTIGNSVTTIGERAFYGCTGMSGSLTIGINVTTIGSNAFFSCKGFKGSLTIPDSVNTIEASAFYGCSGFTGTLTIPDSVITIGQSAFSSCSGFTGSLKIPASITIIESATFSDCTGFNGTLIFPDSIKAIGGYAFYNCSGLTGALTIPDSVTTIGAGAFEGCLGFSGTLFIPELVTSIENNAFSSCSGLIGSLTIPESVTSIGSRAFNGCSGFTGSLTIPDSVTSIGQYAFSGCTGLTDVKCLKTEVPTLGETVFPADIVIRVATGYGDAYRAARNWSTYTNLYEYGDANWSKSLTVTDAVADANYITGAPQAGKFDFECGDINMDTFITIVDATRIVDAVLKYNPSGASAAPAWRAPAQTSGMLEASDFSFDADGYATVDVRYSADRDLVAMQTDLRAGEGVEVVSVEASEKVLATHSFSQSRFDDGTVRVVLFTLGNNPIATEEGETLLRVHLRAADAQATGSLEAVSILASTPDAVETGLSYSGGRNIVASGIEGIDDEDGVIVTGRDGMLRVFHAAGREVSVYDISGRLVRAFTAASDAESVELLSGVYVVRIADKTVKVIL